MSESGKKTRRQITDYIEAGTSILVVDDNEHLRERLAQAFRDRGLDARTAASFEEAIELAEQESPELAVLDLRMPGRSGLELLRELKRIDESTRCVLLTGFGSMATAVDAMRLGATNVIPKPADADEILAAFCRDDKTSLDEPTPEYSAPTLARAEWEHIHRVLSDCGNNITEAARRLGIHRRSLQRKLQKPAPE